MDIIGQGNTAEIYDYGDGRILKLFRSGFPKSAAETEYKKTLMVQKIIDNVPKAYEFLNKDGRYGIIYDRIYGQEMLKTIISSGFKLNYYARKFADYHIQIQKCIDEPIETVKEKLIHDIERTNELDQHTKNKIYDYIKTLPDGNTLCHFDFHPGNIIISDQKPVIIDWMTVCKGDKNADAARTVLMFSYGEVPNVNDVIQKLLHLFQNHIKKVYLKEYLKNTNTKKEDIDKWILPIAAARLSESIPENEKRTLKELINLKIGRGLNQI